jgi:hypothetical protein
MPFVENGQAFLDLPRDRIIKAIDLFFNANAVCASTTNATVLAGVRGALLLVPEIRVVGNGTTVLFEMDAEALHRQNAFDGGILPYYLEPTAATDATYPIGFFVRIPFANQLSGEPMDTALNASLFRSLRLELRFGTIRTSLFAATRAGGADTIAGTFGITPVLHESTYPANPQGMRFQQKVDIPVSATGIITQPLNIEMAKVYQRFMFKSTDVGVPESDIINNLTVKTANTYVHVDHLNFLHLQRMNQVMTSLAAIPAGFAWLLMTENGMLTTGLQTADVNSAQIDLDLTVGAGSTIVRLYTDTIQVLASAG